MTIPRLARDGDRGKGPLHGFSHNEDTFESDERCGHNTGICWKESEGHVRPWASLGGSYKICLRLALGSELDQLAAYMGEFEKRVDIALGNLKRSFPSPPSIRTEHRLERLVADLDQEQRRCKVSIQAEQSSRLLEKAAVDASLSELGRIVGHEQKARVRDKEVVDGLEVQLEMMSVKISEAEVAIQTSNAIDDAKVARIIREREVHTRGESSATKFAAEALRVAEAFLQQRQSALEQERAIVTRKISSREPSQVADQSVSPLRASLEAVQSMRSEVARLHASLEEERKADIAAQECGAYEDRLASLEVDVASMREMARVALSSSASTAPGKPDPA